jgi:hypothetical protein
MVIEQQGETVMHESGNPAPQVPPEVARYLAGAPPESGQFDFLIGDWDVSAIRYKEDGSELLQYKARWNAVHLNEGRMVMDDFKALAPNGQPISSYVTLRTYSEASRRWEMTGLQALQPSAGAVWHGVWTDGEMLLDATGKDPSGILIKTKIRFFGISKSGFSWESSISRGEGKTGWRTASLRAQPLASGS